ncbi:hypothetical protein HY388_01550 [Candidatus Daviesbacteria bacterium]|nr:hypothetical protein [Candidatus Daviesbacteria bacterium]
MFLRKIATLSFVILLWVTLFLPSLFVVQAQTITGLRDLRVNEQVTVTVSGLGTFAYYWVEYDRANSGYAPVYQECVPTGPISTGNITRTVGPFPGDGYYELQIWKYCPGSTLGHTQVASQLFKVGNPTGPAPTGAATLVSCTVGSTTYNNCVATAIGRIPTSPAGFVQFVLQWAIGIAGGIAFLLMLMGAVQVITSQGNPEQLQNGKDHITSAVVGLIFIVLSVILLKIIGVDILGIPGFQ